jgi:Fe-S cluster assembly protein SufD
MSLKETLLDAYIAFENDLHGRTHTPVHQMRSKALALFEEKGFPTTRMEDWKYTQLGAVTKRDYVVLPKSDNGLSLQDIKPLCIDEIDAYRMVFVNGIFSSSLSNTNSNDCKMSCLCDELDHHTPVISERFNRLAQSKEESLTSLNTAFAVEGALIQVPDHAVVSKPIHILYVSTGNGRDVMVQPRNLIVAGKNSRVNLIEQHVSLGNHHVLNNSVTEIFADRDAQLNLYKIQRDSDQSALVDSTYIDQKKQSNVRVFTFALGGKFVRNNLSFHLGEDHAHAELYGFTLLNKNEFADHHTTVDHAVPDCESTELYRGIFDDKSHGVFNGKVIVRPDAQHTNAFQQNNNVLLSDSASIDTKPELEIYADDVRCSHGCTVGELDHEALYYLRSRGIPEREAQAMLLIAFKGDIVSKIHSESLRKYIDRLIAEKLGVNLELDL